MFRALLIVSGHRVADFTMERCADDRHMRVHGPYGVGTYPLDGWISAFGRHLYKGFFAAHFPDSQR
jgi:hypothetical protein